MTVTNKPKAQYHSNSFGAPCLTLVVIRSKSKNRFNEAITSIAKLTNIPIGPD
jgi:hypothetical protein